jgi:hypothetical protein
LEKATAGIGIILLGNSSWYLYVVANYHLPQNENPSAITRRVGCPEASNAVDGARGIIRSGRQCHITTERNRCAMNFGNAFAWD